jgi:hypothetical protein
VSSAEGEWQLRRGGGGLRAATGLGSGLPGDDVTIEGGPEFVAVERDGMPVRSTRTRMCRVLDLGLQRRGRGTVYLWLERTTRARLVTTGQAQGPVVQALWRRYFAAEQFDPKSDASRRCQGRHPYSRV